MDEKQKLNIIQNLIENRFDKDNFAEFISNVLNITVRNRKESTAVWTEYKKYVESYQIFGDYEDSNNQRIYIIAVKVKDNVDPTRAKVKQREIIAKMLREYRKDGALVAFYSEAEPVWRMAFVKLEYSFTAKGLEEKLTPAKRLSYVVGEGEASHTVKKQFMTLIKLDTEVTLNNLEELFQLEKVTDDFFKEYKEKYLDLKDYLETNEEFMKEARKQNFENPESFSEGFAKKLMGQLAFLYFLQKKGWLGVTIVPKELTIEEYNNILNRALPEEKDLLINTYNQKGDIFRLSSESMNYSIQDADKLANCFKNHPKFDGFWGTGDKKFIRKLFQRHSEIKGNTGKDRTFFDDYLEELFYEALNLDRGSNQYFKKFNCKIPFLNGGLFEPYDNYDWKNTDFKIPDTLFSNENKDGILDIFDRYNFTISENEPYETEVAVDPEMLGKVFENLLDVSDRKSKGAFYTPREIVHYMCKESLINYLLNEIENVNREEIEYLIQLGEFTREYDEHIFEKDYMDYLKGDAPEFTNAWGMPESIRKNAHKIDEIIKDVRVADPAIGSGAFPLGMLNEIVKVRNILTQYILFEEALKNEKLDIDIYRNLRYRIYNSRSLYNLKIETIENSLYGVDIEPSAVDIAKLRLWLSIVVDTRDNDIRPLPNLDFNFMVGNSLIDEFDGVQLFDEKLLTKKLKETYTQTTNKLFNTPMGYQKDLFGGIESLKIDIMLDLDKYHKAFFKERNTEKKKELKSEIEKLEWQLITETLTASGNQSKIKELEKLKQQKRKPYFLWKLEFAKVFQQKSGFDIVIGNPPYIKERGNKEVFEVVNNSNFGKKYHQGKMDYWFYFMHIAIDLLQKDGIVSFITPRYWINSSGSTTLIKRIKEKMKFINIVDIGKLSVFDNVVGHHMISILTKNKSISNCKYKLLKNTIKLINSEVNNDDVRIKYLDNEEIITPKYEINFDVDDINMNNCMTLDEICEVSQGVVEASDKVNQKKIRELNLDNRYLNKGIFVLNKEEFNELNLNDSERKILKSYLYPKNVQKYKINKREAQYLIYSDNISKMNILENDEFKTLKKHLDSLKNFITSSNKPYGLHRPRKSKFFENEKIIFKGMFKEPEFMIDSDKYYFGMSFLSIIKKENILVDLKSVLGILNSKLALYWFYKNGKKRGVGVDIGVDKIRSFPIHKNILNQKNTIEILEAVNSIIKLKEQNLDTSELEKNLDDLIFIMYELNLEEIKQIRDFTY